MKKHIWSIIHFFRGIFFNRQKALQNGLVLFVPESDRNSKKLAEVKRRLDYFDTNIKIQFRDKPKLKNWLDFTLVGFINSSPELKKKFALKKDQLFDFDFETHNIEGWDYHKLMWTFQHDKVLAGQQKGKEILKNLKKTLSAQYDKAYILGTGPSLEKASSQDWSDGIRIVSNTIVRDAELWNHINPHFIVAGDGIYHFGIGKFAKAFREDLKKRLTETKTYFVFPDTFYPLVLKEFSDFKDRLIPVPYGFSTVIHKDLTNDYTLPRTSNVLPLLLLPLATTLAKHVYLWGFDGRSPDAKLFWKNSPKQFYTEYVDELMELHPAFFNAFVPKNSPDSYVKKVHGDSLEIALREAEREGYTFKMMHFSYTKVLQDRT
jgi:hypothetical protein